MLRQWKKKYVLGILCALFVFGLRAQDIALSQYYANMLCLNPAYAGYHNKVRWNTYYRNQWLGTGAGYKSYAINYDTYVSQLHGGIGVRLSNETAGSLQNPSVDLIYSHGIKVNQHLYFSFGMQAGIVQRYRSLADLEFEEQEIVSASWGNMYPDFALGGIFFYKNIFGGLAVDHVLRPYQTESRLAEARLNRRYTVQLGGLIPFKGRLIKQKRMLSPNILVQIYGPQNYLSWGANFQYDYLIGGLWLRHNVEAEFDALIFSAGIKTQSYKFAYSYDVNLGKKANIPLGAHELSFSLMLEKREKMKKKMVPHPSFLN